MGFSILHGKICCPELRQDYVLRPGLIQRFNAGRYKKLTTIVAGAGYGISSILAEWVRGLYEDVRVLWYSLDASTQDCCHFCLSFYRVERVLG